ncbi:hypothetical protein [Microbacterium invictum]|uniref:Secreted protein n=1 Tax=Microbacterium invictum TaxID=515415 RepID=A0AA40VM01_9MICO|nr:MULTISPECIES: hypothetical protein [Microbacterium]MBB4139337.1 hypothetical protein [Microbacterium invictum]
MTRGRFVAFGLAVLAVVGIAAGTGATSSTQAAWTDRVYVTATATSGTWAAAKGTCTAWGQGGVKLSSCEVAGIRVEGWNDGAKVIRNYYITFATPSQAEYVDFTVDLTAATGSTPPMSWSNAGVRTGAQFTPAGGWTCASLPTVKGRTTQWNTGIMYFVVVSDKTGESVVCP